MRKPITLGGFGGFFLQINPSGRFRYIEPQKRLKMSLKNIVVIGASTGGPETLRKVFSDLLVLDACAIIVQHMPVYVNESVREEIASVTNMEIKLAENGDPLQHGRVYLAPSLVHTEIRSNRGIALVKGEKVNFVCPSIDVTMKSLIPVPTMNIVGIVLTGMGSDGAHGISHIKQLGGITIAQDEPTSIIYGMPKAAAETGDVDFVLPMAKIPLKIIEIINSGKVQTDNAILAIKR